MSFRSEHKRHHSLDRDRGIGDSDHEWNSANGRVNSFDSEKGKESPERDFRSEPRKTLFIGRLNATTTEELLRKHFARFGDIQSLFLIRDIITGDSRRYAFIEYHRTKEADRAYAEGHNSMLDGRRILVDREFGRTMKGWKPRRFGGGSGGGFKESGPPRFGGGGGGGGGGFGGRPGGSSGGRPNFQRPSSSFGNQHHHSGHSSSSNYGGGSRDHRDRDHFSASNNRRFGMDDGGFRSSRIHPADSSSSRRSFSRSSPNFRSSRR